MLLICSGHIANRVHVLSIEEMNLIYYILLLQVMADMREFRSALPSLLHKRGMTLFLACYS